MWGWGGVGGQPYEVAGCSLYFLGMIMRFWYRFWCYFYIIMAIAVPFRSFITKVIEMQILFWSPFKLERYSQDKITVTFKGLFRHTSLLHASS